LPTIDFEFDAVGNPLLTSQVIDEEWAAWGVHVTVVPDDYRDGPAIIFDSSNPGSWDMDLGTPNQAFGGPGVGSGGGPGPGANVISQGKVLVIKENSYQQPNDSGEGGSIIFTFDQPVQIDEVHILDIDSSESAGTVKAYGAGDVLIGSAAMQPLGDNSFQVVTLNVVGAYKLEVHFPSSGGVPAVVFCAEPAVDIEKATNGEDADAAPGPSIAVGDPVTWEYVVTNTGNVPLFNLSVSDSDLGSISCPKSALAAGESMTCTASGTAAAGQYANTGFVTGEYDGTTVSDEDDSHYFGVAASIHIEKYVSVDGQATWEDADTSPGPEVSEGDDVYFRFVVTNDGDVELTNITLSDTDFDLSGCSITDPLATGASFECVIGPFAAVEGQHTDTGATSGQYDGMTVTDSDDAYYYGSAPCGECKGKVTQLTLKYIGSTPNAHIKVYQKKPYVKVFDGIVQPGGEFTFTGQDDKGTLSTEITIYVNCCQNTTIHTSCSQPIGPGLIRGDFEVIEGYSREGGLLCPLYPLGSACEECKEGVTFSLAERNASP
jgi:hypothetical protein